MPREPCFQHYVSSIREGAGYGLVVGVHAAIGNEGEQGAAEKAEPPI
jgi:hypothetical protein